MWGGKKKKKKCEFVEVTLHTVHFPAVYAKVTHYTLAATGIIMIKD